MDALCELPGIDVCATATDAKTALGIVDRSHVDVIVTTNDLRGASLVTLIDDARRRGVSDIIVALTARATLIPGMVDYWKDLGARYVCDRLSAVIRVTSSIVTEREHAAERRRALAHQLELAVALGHSPSLRSYSSLHAGITPVRSAPPTRMLQEVSPAALLEEALGRFGKILSPDTELILEIGDDIPRVRCTVGDIERIALHLVLDARDAIPFGGKIWLFVEREGVRHVRIEVMESSGRPRTPGVGVDVTRAIVKRNAGQLHIVDHEGGTMSLQVLLPAVVVAPS
ncbi:MAG TPA: hypothetical protein VFV99_28010 [Kofleriaceae bacterium]|nr:hypothetical protein [Kofleriaceae bacterium]